MCMERPGALTSFDDRQSGDGTIRVFGFELLGRLHGVLSPAPEMRVNKSRREFISANDTHGVTFHTSRNRRLEQVPSPRESTRQ